MRGLDKLEAPALDEREVAALKFELEIERMEAGAEQHRDFPELHAFLAQFQDPLRHEARLRMLVGRAHQRGTEFALAPGVQDLGVFLGGARNNLVGDVEDALHRAIVLFELDDRGAGKDFREIQDVAEVRAAKRVDRLRVVTHRHHVAMLRRQQAHDLGLHRVGVLVFVDHDVAIGLGQTAAHLVVLRQQLDQTVEQVVVVEQPARALVGLVFQGELENFGAVLEQVREIDLDFLLEAASFVARHADRLGQRALFRKTPLARAETHPRA